MPPDATIQSIDDFGQSITQAMNTTQPEPTQGPRPPTTSAKDCILRRPGARRPPAPDHLQQRPRLVQLRQQPVKDRLDAMPRATRTTYTLRDAAWSPRSNQTDRLSRRHLLVFAYPPTGQLASLTDCPKTKSLSNPYEYRPAQTGPTCYPQISQFAICPAARIGQAWVTAVSSASTPAAYRTAHRPANRPTRRHR